MRRPRSSTPLCILLTALVACVWLNQSVGGKDWEAIRDAVYSAPAEHPLEAARYPFVFLYRRSLDERYYFETAAAMLGKPADEAVVRQMHGRMPASFDERLPPADGHWHAPYTEVAMEYPPLDLPFFVGPRLVAATFAGYGYLFGALMGLCMLGGITAAIAAARRGGCDAGGVRTRWLLSSGLLVAQGALAIQRLDPIAALFLGLALYAAACRKPFALGVAMGLAGAAKLLPLLLLPVIVASDWGAYQKDRRGLALIAAGAGAALVVGFGPMLFSPRAAGVMLGFHLARGLNVESTLGIALGALRAMAGHAEAAPASFGSQNLDGAAADLLARLTAPLMLACLGALVWRLGVLASTRPAASNAARVTRITTAALAGAVVVWVTGKVLSPQYLTWSIPLVLAIPGRLGTRLAWVAILAMAVTQLYTRGFYDLVVAQAPIALATLAARQALLFGLLALAARGLDGGVEPAPAGVAA